jgi:hypothetical protein
MQMYLQHEKDSYHNQLVTKHKLKITLSPNHIFVIQLLQKCFLSNAAKISQITNLILMQIAEDLENKLAYVKIVKKVEDLNTRVAKNTEKSDVSLTYFENRNLQ